MSDDLYYGEVGPNKQEYRLTGCCGIIIFSCVFGVATLGLSRLEFKKPTAQTAFYIGICLMALCELPRYFEFALKREYVSRIGYAFHILGGTFFFVSLCVVCFLWANILKLGPMLSLIYSKKGLGMAIVILGSVQVGAICACLSSSSLVRFFHSTFFIIFVVEEILQSLIYSTGLWIYGLQLIFRLRNYAAASSNMIPLQVALRRLTITLGVTSVSSMLRLIMCALQIGSLKTGFNFSSDSFPHYGLLWFTLAEFLPRGASALALNLLMMRGRGYRRSGSVSGGFLSSRHPKYDVSSAWEDLAPDSSFYGLGPSGNLSSSNSTSEPLLGNLPYIDRDDDSVSASVMGSDRLGKS